MISLKNDTFRVFCIFRAGESIRWNEKVMLISQNKATRSFYTHRCTDECKMKRDVVLIIRKKHIWPYQFLENYFIVNT